MGKAARGDDGYVKTTEAERWCGPAHSYLKLDHLIHASVKRAQLILIMGLMKLSGLIK